MSTFYESFFEKLKTSYRILFNLPTTKEDLLHHAILDTKKIITLTVIQDGVGPTTSYIRNQLKQHYPHYIINAATQHLVESKQAVLYNEIIIELVNMNHWGVYPQRRDTFSV